MIASAGVRTVWVEAGGFSAREDPERTLADVEREERERFDALCRNAGGAHDTFKNGHVPGGSESGERRAESGKRKANSENREPSPDVRCSMFAAGSPRDRAAPTCGVVRAMHVRNVLKVVRDRPGVRLAELPRAVSLSYAQCVRAVRTLVGDGRVVMQRVGLVVGYWERSAAPAFTSVAERVLDLVHERPGLTVRQAAAEIGCAPMSIYHALRKRLPAGAVVLRERGLYPGGEGKREAGTEGQGREGQRAEGTEGQGTEGQREERGAASIGGRSATEVDEIRKRRKAVESGSAPPERGQTRSTKEAAAPRAFQGQRRRGASSPLATTARPLRGRGNAAEVSA